MHLAQGQTIASMTLLAYASQNLMEDIAQDHRKKLYDHSLCVTGGDSCVVALY